MTDIAETRTASPIFSRYMRFFRSYLGHRGFWKAAGFADRANGCVDSELDRSARAE